MPSRAEILTNLPAAWVLGVAGALIVAEVGTLVGVRAPRRYCGSRPRLSGSVGTDPTNRGITVRTPPIHWHTRARRTRSASRGRRARSVGPETAETDGEKMDGWMDEKSGWKGVHQ